METPKNPHKHVSLFEKSYLLSISGWLYIHTIQLFETCRRSRIGYENNEEIGHKKLWIRRCCHRGTYTVWSMNVIWKHEWSSVWGGVHGYSQGEIKLINWDPNDNGVISIYNPLNQSSIINSKPIFLMGKHQMITLWLFNSSPWKDPPFF